ncbi:DUF3892 domain-containing protein [Isoptericola sp. NPDC019482]|uniref:DUF3892 domain-containing protein n=1 Tax=Isoptericola sp. NPDC019482 TaxID=3154688 RepID=UPI00348D1291
MPFIHSVRVADPGTHNEHIEAVAVSQLTTGPLRVASRDAVHTDIVRGTRYRTLHPVTHEQTDVVARISPRGTRYIATVANGTETDNLLRLPRF